MTRAATLALLALLLAPGRGLPQQPEERHQLRLLQDSLQGAVDSLQLHQLEQRTIDVARVQRDDPMLHLRLGILAIRLGEVSGRASHFDDAAGEFEWAASLRPDWPWPWYGLGLAESLLPDRARTAFGALQVMLGQNRDRLAGAAFARAVRLDPGFTEALTDFAATVLDERINAPIDQAIDALRAATASRVGWDPKLLLLLGRLERLAGHVDSARVDFTRSRRLAIRPAVPLLELARTLPMTADTVAYQRGGPNPVELAYFSAAESDDPEVVEMLHRDLASITTDSALAELDRVHGAARVEWLRRFWATRDAADLRPPGSRLMEHYRRWNQAMREFRLPPFRRRYRYGIELFQSRDADFDDRGVIWLRHGAPQKRIVWPSSLQLPGLAEPDWGDETWRYERPDGDLVLHFAAHDDLGDYRLVESVFSLGMSPDALAASAADVPGLNRLLQAGPNSRPFLRAEERLKSRRDVAVATTTDSWVRHFPEQVLARVELAPVGTRGEAPLVHLIYSLSSASITAEGTPGDAATHPLELRAVFFDSAGHPLATLDTVEQIRPPAAPPGGMVSARAEVTVPSTARLVRVALELSPTKGVLFPLDTIRVPRVRGPGLDLSALVVSAIGRGLLWRSAPADSTWFDAVRLYHPGDTLLVYAEAYGVQPGVEYSTRLSIRRQRSALVRFLTGRPETITISEQAQFAERTGRYRRAVALAGLPAGNYLVELEITGPGGSLTRRQLITLKAPEQGSGGS